jgi:enoyl-CoA hydratase/carnithine racemase
MEETQSGTPRFSAGEGIARIVLQRPAHRNRLQREDLSELRRLFSSVDADASIRVVILGADVLPDRPVFSAGFHIGDFNSGEPEVSLEDIMIQLERLRPVTICALNGSVYGGASDFPLACDFALAAEGVVMRVPAAAIGLHYHPTGLVRYISRIGVSAAKRAFLTAEPLDTETLRRVGYVQEVWPADHLDERVTSLAQQIAGLAPLALDFMKKSLNELARGEADPQRLEERSRLLKESEDFIEGRRAFAEKRIAIWKGR